MPDLISPPKLRDSTLELANGVIATRVTSQIPSGDDVVLPIYGHGIVRNGEFLNATGTGPFVLPVTPVGVAVEISLQLNEWRNGRTQKAASGRTVSVPDQATVTWDDLLDTVPAVPSGEYVVPPWVYDILEARDEAEAAAGDAAAHAAAAADSVATIDRGGPNGVAPLDADSRVPDGNLPARLAASALSANFAPKNADFINAKQNGVLGDGSANDTTAIQTLITANPGRTIYFPAGTYMVNASVSGNVGLRMNQPGVKLLLDQGATLKVIPNNHTNYALMEVSAPDCAIEGGTILGDAATHLGSTGEWGHLIIVSTGADRCRIQGVTVKQAWGDGIIVQLGPADVSIIDVVADDNRRQGLSITGSLRTRVVGGVYKNTGLTNWTLPCAGIDIEPNPSSAYSVIDASIIGATLYNNRGEGLLAIRATGVTTEATVSDCYASQNGAGATAPGFRAGGSAGTMLMKFVNLRSESNTGHGFEIFAPDVEATACTAKSNTLAGFHITGLGTMLNGPTATANGGAGINLAAGSDVSAVVGGITSSNSQTTTGAASNVEISSGNVRMSGHVAVAGSLTNKPAYGYNLKTGAGARLYGCDVQGTYVTGNFVDTPGTTTMFPRPGASKGAAITSPTADVTALKTAVDAVRAILTSYGLTP